MTSMWLSSQTCCPVVNIHYRYTVSDVDLGPGHRRFQEKEEESTGGQVGGGHRCRGVPTRSVVGSRGPVRECSTPALWLPAWLGL